MTHDPHNFTDKSGVIMREDGTLFVWSNNTRIEVLLNHDQMIELGKALLKISSKKHEVELCQKS